MAPDASGHLRSAPLSRRLLLLVASVAVPLTLMGAGTLWMQYRAERSRAETQLVEQARGLARLVDREFERMETAIRILAASAALAQGDLDAFAKELIAARNTLSAGLPAGAQPVRIRLLDAQGWLRLDTYVLDGGEAFQRGMPHAMAAITSVRTQISDLHIGPQTGLPYVVITAPLLAPASGASGPNHIVGAIGASVPRERLLAIVMEAGLPPGAVASVHDRKGITVARSSLDAETVGKPPLPGVSDAILGSDAGLAPRGVVTLEGVRSVVAYAHAPLSGYIAQLNIPETVLVAPLWAALLQTAAIGAAVLAAGLGTAAFMARRIVAAFHHVPAAAAEAAETDEPIAARTGLREADQLVAAIASAEARRRESAADFGLLAETMPGWVFVSDAAGRNTYINRNCSGSRVRFPGLSA